MTDTKKIEAFISPDRLPEVIAALHALPRFPGFTVLEGHGQGQGRGAGGQYLYVPSEGLLFHQQRLLIIFCGEDICDQILNVIVRVACTGRPGDGMIAISDVGQLVRVRDGQSHP